MLNLLRILDQGDLCVLGLVVVILVMLGNQLAGETERRWARALGIVAFLAYGFTRLVGTPPRWAEELLEMTVRALVASGLVFGMALLIVPLAAMTLHGGLL